MKEQWMCKALMKHMKNFVVYSMISCACLNPLDAFAQGDKVFTVKSGTVDSIFRQISAQQQLDFFYDTALLDRTKKVTLSDETGTLKEILDQIFKGTKLSYELRGTSVLIFEKSYLKDRTAKNIVLKGTIKDKTGIPLPGVTVLLKGTTTGCTSDMDGNYSINVPNAKNLTLVYSFIGMETQELKFKGNRVMDVILEEEQQVMDEVVVTGYQVIDKRQLTSAVSTVNAKDLEKMNVLRVDQMLEGKAAGLMVTNFSSTPGAAAKVRVRSGGTFTGSREPLWVVDGVIYEDPVPLSAAEINSFDSVNLIGNAITGLNPQDIESINILKDASATAIYGTRAANGVIVVTTKRGKKGNAHLNYSGSVGFVDRPRYRNFKLMNSKERIDVSREIYEKNLAYPEDIISYVGYEGALRKYLKQETTFAQFNEEVAGLETMNTDWFGALYRPSVTTAHSVNISGGTDNTRYYFSVGFNQNNGTERGVGLNRLTARSNVDTKLRHNVKLSLTMSGSVQEAEYNHGSINVFDEAYYNNRAMPFRQENGDLFFVEQKINERNGKILTSRYNIFNEMQNSEKNIDNKDFNISGQLNWDIMKGIKFTGSVSYRNTTNINEQWITENTHYIAKLRTYDKVEDKIDELVKKQSNCPFGGMYNTGYTTQRSWSAKAQLNLNKVLWEDHSFNLNLGYEANSTKYVGVSGITAPGYNHTQGRSFIALPSFQLDPRTGDLKNFEYSNMVKWLTASGTNIYPNITDRLKNSISYFMIFNYSYKNRYIFNFNMRSDGSNSFGQYTRYKFRPTWSISGRWNIYEEEFIPKGGAMEELSLRMSYGFRGNTPSALPYMVLSNYQYDADFGENLSRLQSFPNANLAWEQTSTVNFGINHSWFNGRLSGSFDFAYSKGKDLLLSRPVSYVNGQGTQLYNGGSKEDYSYEMSLRGVLVKTKNFGWSMNGNITHTKETVLAGQVLENRNYNVSDYLNGSIYLTGFPVDAFYSYQFDGLDEYGHPNFKNLEGWEPSVASYFQKVLKYSGRRTPTVYGGFGTEFRYKDFTLSANFSYKFGQKIRRLSLYNGRNQTMPMPYEGMSAEYLDRWRQPGDEAYCVIPGLSNEKLLVGQTSGDKFTTHVPYPDIVPDGNRNRWFMYDMSDLRVVKGDHIRWQSLTLGYNVPKNFTKMLGLSYIRLNAQVSNLGCLTFDKKLKGQDPEQVQGVGMPSLPSFNFGLNVSF